MIAVALKAARAPHPPPTREDLEAAVDAEWRALYRATAPPSASIPRFYHRHTNIGTSVDASTQSLHSHYTSVTHASLLSSLSQSLLTPAQFLTVRAVIESQAMRTLSLHGGDVGVSYDTYSACAAVLTPAQRQYLLPPSLFAELPPLSSSLSSSLSLSVSGYHLLMHLLYRNHTQRLSLSLACYISATQTHTDARLTEQDLMNYIYDNIAAIDCVRQSLSQDFYPYYVFTIIRKILFFLDTGHRGFVPLLTLAQSSFVTEFEAMKGDSLWSTVDTTNSGSVELLGVMQDAITIAATKSSRLGLALIGEDCLSSSLSSCTDPGRLITTTHPHTGTSRLSWFHPTSAQQLYGLYLSLDADNNGMLTQSELQTFRSGALNPLFLQSLYQSIPLFYNDSTGQWEMDYKGFLDLMLAFEYSHSAEAIQYLFSILDSQHVGFIDRACIVHYFTGIRDKLLSLGHSQIVSSEVMADELFDMTGCATGRMTVQDLMASRVGHTVLLCLIDVQGFWKYDHREQLMNQPQDH